jgi:lysophospholipase L1-like esterase
MKSIRCALGWGVLAASAAAVFGAGPPGSAGFVSAADPRFRYAGRVDFADPAAPAIIWEGSQIGLDFSGDRIGVDFGSARGQNYFDADVDGRRTVVAVPEGAGRRIDLMAPDSSVRRHRLVLFKRSEASVGDVHFTGVNLEPGAAAWTAASPAFRLRMEFLGDSITVGACNEDGPADQWDERRTHDYALSYASLVAAAFRADQRAIAVSGMGVVAGWVDVTAAQVWDRRYPRADAPRDDLAAWTPDVVCVLLGENDNSYTQAHGRPFPESFASRYESLVRQIRAAYPRAWIVLLRGAMYGGARSPALRAAWERAVGQLEIDDPRVSHFVFTHWSDLHPRVRDDRILADELIAWMKVQPGMRPFLGPGAGGVL